MKNRTARPILPEVRRPGASDRGRPAQGLPQHRQDHLGRQENRRRRHSSGLRVPGGKCGFLGCLREGGHHLHRTSPPGDQEPRRQGRCQEDYEGGRDPVYPRDGQPCRQAMPESRHALEFGKNAGFPIMLKASCGGRRPRHQEGQKRGRAAGPAAHGQDRGPVGL